MFCVLRDCAASSEITIRLATLLIVFHFSSSTEIYRLISRKTMADAGAAPSAAIPQGQNISLNASNAAPEKKAGGCC